MVKASPLDSNQFQKLSPFDKGLSLLRRNMLNQASLEFHKAMQSSQEDTARGLINLFHELYQSNELETAFHLGNFIFEYNKEDSEFVNALGNCARRLGKQEMANDFYRMALRANRSFDRAVLNLAASMAGVRKFDYEIKDSIVAFANFKNFILPDPLEIQDKTISTRLLNFIINKAQLYKDNRISELIRQKEAFVQNQQTHKIKEITLTIKDEFEKDMPGSLNQPEAERILEYILEKEWDQIPPDEKKAFHIPLHNLLLNSIENNNNVIARTCLNHLKGFEDKIKHELMFEGIILSKEGQLEKAIEVMIQEAKRRPYDRFVNINLGLLYKQIKNKLSACRFLLKGAQQIENLEGLYRASEIIALANRYYQEENIPAALRLFEAIIEEVDTIKAWGSLGNIYLDLKEFQKAAKCFKEVVRHHPESALAKKKLQQIHDYYCEQADELSRNNQNRKAVEFYEKALEIMRPARTLKLAADLNKFLKNNNRTFELMAEHRETIFKEKEEEKEIKRLELIETAKYCMKKKDFNNAIKNFELAFPMRLDKDVFMYLAHIYKVLNRSKALTNLLAQWRTLNAFSEKRKKYEDTA